MKYLQVAISAENEKDARKIAGVLLEKKLIAGVSIANSPSHFWWKGEIIEMKNYCYVHAFSMLANKKKIVEVSEKSSKEKIPMLFFSEFESNPKFGEWINKTLSKQ